MNSELYIEGSRLDISKESTALLTFSIDDIKDFSSRSTTWSKTIVLPGTANNNKVFGHIFQIGISNSYFSNLSNVGSNFNASVSARCILFQDQMQTFTGSMRLMQINYTNGLNGRVEYEVSIFGNLSNLNSILSGRLLENLDFSEYNHQYLTSNIHGSWDNPGGSGYYYPLIDYGNYSLNKHDWDIRTFRPALYAKEYIDKIFSSANFRYECALFDSARFKGLVIPHNKKYLTSNQSNLIDAKVTTQQVVDDALGSTIISLIVWNSFTGTGFTTADGSTFTYNGSITNTIPLTFNIFGNINNTTDITLQIFKNGTSGTQLYFSSDSSGSATYNFSSTITFSISPGDTIHFQLTTHNYGFTIEPGSSFSVSTNAVVPVIINPGAEVKTNESIPKNIRQIDFLVGIVKLWNLYIYEDKNDPYLIHITPFIDFYSKNFSNALDWTYKLDRNKPIKSKPMSELNAKIYNFKFKSDSDYYNDLYKKRYNEGYGDRVYDTQFEFSQQTNSFDIVFSATPLVGYAGEDKKYSTIFKRNGTDASPVEENTDSNIRLLQTKKIIGVAAWDIKDGASGIATQTAYGYAGHLDDPTIPTNDLNFGATKELFFTLTSGNLSDNQFNVYWSTYMADITNKDSKLVSAYFKLDTKDILALDFSKYIYIDGITFRLNKIIDYNVTYPGVCLVELLKVSSAAYTEATNPNGPPDGCFLLWSDAQTLDWNDGDPLTYSSCEDNPGDGGGGDPDPDIKNLNWTFTRGGIGGAWVGNMKIYQNGTLVGSISSAPFGIGSFVINAGDTIKVDITSTSRPVKTKNIAVSNDVDGSVFSGSSSSSGTYTYTFAVVAGRNYNVTTSLT